MNTKENSFALLALFNRQARKAGFSDQWVRESIKKATASDRDNLLAVLAEGFAVIEGKKQ
jgi:hypothetical protein